MQVCSQCPALKGHENEIDKILAKSLIEAKHYNKKNFW